MNLLFAAGDVGGARAILPLARLAYRKHHTINALINGTLHAEGEELWNWHTKSHLLSNKYWEETPPDHFIYATSVSDTEALDISSLAKTYNVPMLHVLDNWSNYSDRFIRGKEHWPLPDLYAVMDELALQTAIDEGIKKDTLFISGHPNLATLNDQHVSPKFKDTPKNILFVSEPAKIDNTSHKHRGYDEEEVSLIFQKILYAAPPEKLRGLSLKVAVHPRENLNELTKRWLDTPKTDLGINIQLVQNDDTRKALLNADYVIGMSSILLYEAWLFGKEVISIQPNLSTTSLRSFFYRDGLTAFTSAVDASHYLEQIFITNHVKSKNSRRQQHLNLHKNASHTLLSKIEHS